MTNLKENDLAAAILAGGNSTRFGRSKLEVVFRGERLLDRALKLARALSDDTILISGKRQLPIDNVRVYRDVIPDCGPMGGIYTALKYAERPYVAIMPVDMPLLTKSVYDELQKHIRESPVEALSHTGLEPLVSIWPQSALAAAEEMIDRKQYKLYQLLKKLRAVQVNLPEKMPDYREEWFLNINCREDLIG